MKEEGREWEGEDAYIDFKLTHVQYVWIAIYTMQIRITHVQYMQSIDPFTYRCKAETEYCVVVLLHFNMHLVSYT